MATRKHFAAHGQPESGMNCGPVNVSERVLRETFLYPFQQAIRKAGAISVMASYNEINGVPSHASRWLLDRLLRKEWGFTGFVVSDFYAIWELGHRPDTHGHFVAADKKESCCLAVEAGVNIELPEPDCYLSLAELVRKGVIAERRLDELVRPMLLRLASQPMVRSASSGSSLTGGAREGEAAEERKCPAAAERGETEDDCGDRAERPSLHTGWVQRRAQA